MTTTTDPLLTALRCHFGHAEFIGCQRAVVEHALAGGDALVLMPTGSGKSICYQLPALLREGVTVVLSPLIALMQDQVEKLVRLGLPATFVNSALSRDERERRIAALARGECKLVYVTPERFRSEVFTTALRKNRVALLAVDEAHCVSAWGHDFRPEYGKVGDIRAMLGDPPTLALTATATPRTQDSIRSTLRIHDARVFSLGIERKNLRVFVRETRGADERVARIARIATTLRGPGIVYMALIQELQRTQERLHALGIEAAAYHGDLSASERRRVQRRFLESKDGLLLATNAFGLGVDKPDIRFIVHGQVPGSVEAYTQEIGRAGRDGATSLCELLYDPEDIAVQQRFVEWANPDAEFLRRVVAQLFAWGDTLHARTADELRDTLLVKSRGDGRVETALALLRAERVIDGSFEDQSLHVLRPLAPGEESKIVPPGKRERDLSRLLDVVRFVRDAGCRKRAIHAYFGIDVAPDWCCGACDLCCGQDAFAEGMEPPTPSHERTVVADDGPSDVGAPVAVGDWLRIDGRHTVVVTKVEWDARGLRIEGQSAGDFRFRRYDLSRVPWERVSRDGE
ncbi:MAG: RecQ family ATP-dependent DNA helicase [Planctomycetes bacterium]|nr:RecQ family ATP-dependent DNA helicase [Planctomycetota bacterium]MCC7170936.1 RecQ family ATP-dependent DNA helicase [Planctomycetota bacterium]